MRSRSGDKMPPSLMCGPNRVSLGGMVMERLTLARKHDVNLTVKSVYREREFNQPISNESNPRNENLD